MAESFQDFIDACGLAKGFRMDSRGLTALQCLYDEWRASLPPSARGDSSLSWAAARRVKGGIEIQLDGGATFVVRL